MSLLVTNLDNSIIVGQNVREIRKNLNLTQEEFAEKFNCDAKTISRLETGRTFTSADTIQEICKAFNILPQELFKLNNLSVDEDMEKQELLDIFLMQLRNQDKKTIENLLKVNKTILETFNSK